MVSAPASPSGRFSDCVSGPSGPVVSGRGQDFSPSGPRPSSFCLESVRSSLRAQGVSEDVAALAAKARRPSTIRTYDSRLLRFREWCSGCEVSATSASLERVSSFLKLLFDEGKSISTVRNYRSAIGAIHSGFPDGSSLGDNEVLAQLIRGMSVVRPVVRCLVPSWSINQVLRGLAEPPFEPLGVSSLANLTHKTLFLVATASARRRSCLQALSIKPGYLRWEPNGVRLVPDPEFLPKNQTLDFVPGDIFIPRIESLSSVAEDRKWCPVRALKWYVKRTESCRQSSRLFVLPRAPFTAASRDTISRWLVDIIAPHATGAVRAHQVRGQAASKALFAGVPVQDILKAAAWKTPSTFVACYLTDTLGTEAAFGRAVLAVPARRSVRPPTLPVLD